MSPRSIYFRDQADACWRLAILLTDAETKEQLREMAVELIKQAAEIEGKGILAETAILLDPAAVTRSASGSRLNPVQ
jgi:hypothetical protein